MLIIDAWSYPLTHEQEKKRKMICCSKPVKGSCSSGMWTDIASIQDIIHYNHSYVITFSDLWAIPCASSQQLIKWSRSRENLAYYLLPSSNIPLPMPFTEKLPWTSLQKGLKCETSKPLVLGIGIWIGNTNSGNKSIWNQYGRERIHSTQTYFLPSWKLFDLRKSE
jgi:hypothetical protein